MRKHVLTFLLVASLPLAMMAQSGITEPGATEPTQLYTTTYDNPSGPNHAPAGGPNRTGEVPSSWGGGGGSDAGYVDPASPVGAPWVLLAFAAAYAGVRLVKRGKKGVEE